MALLPRRTAVIATFAAALIAGAVVPVGSAFGAGAGVAAPTPTGPANNSTTPLKSVVLTWNSVAGASHYQVQVSPNDEWTNNTVTLPDSGTTVNALYEMPLSLPHGGYFWRVRAEVGSTWGAYSAPRQFLRQWESAFTILKAPTGSDPSIAWTPVKFASTYLVRFSTDPGFPSDPSKTFSCFTHQTSFTPYATSPASLEEADANPCFSVSDLTDGTPYFWQVEALDDSTAPPLVADTTPDPNWDCAQAQPECDADAMRGSFNFTAPADGVVSALSVTGLASTWHTTTLPGTTCNAATSCATTPTLSWNAVPGANLYHVQIFRDADETNTYRAYDTAWPEVTPRDSFFDTQAGNGYYWRVVAETCTDLTDLTTCTAHIGSSQASFTKTSGPVSLGAPANGAVEHGRSITFSWGDYQITGGRNADDARNYALQVAKNSSFTNPLIDVRDVDLTQYTDPTAVLSDGTYFWRVAPIDESGNTLSWSTTRHVTVNAKGPTVSFTTKSGVGVTGPLTIHISEAVSGVSTSTVHVVPSGETASHAVAGTLKLGANANTYTFRPSSPLVTGGTYALSVSPSLVDSNGNNAVVAGKGVRTTTVASDTSKGWHFSGGWTKHAASGARSGSYVSAAAGHKATIKVAGASATLYACKGPTMGSVTVTIAGHSQKVSEKQAFTKCGVAIWHQALDKGAQKLTITVHKHLGNIDEVVA